MEKKKGTINKIIGKMKNGLKDINGNSNDNKNNNNNKNKN